MEDIKWLEVDIDTTTPVFGRSPYGERAYYVFYDIFRGIKI